MERLKSIIYRFAILVAVVSLITSFFSGVSLYTSLIRSGVVFLLTLIIVILVLNVIRRVLIHTTNSSTDIENGSK